MEIDDTFDGIDKGEMVVKNKTTGNEYKMTIDASDRQKEMLKNAGLINKTRKDLEQANA